MIMVLTSATSYGMSVATPEYAPVFTIQPDGIHIAASDFANIASPGNPALPYKELRIILPPNINTSSVTINLCDDKRSNYAINGEIAPAPPILASIDGNEIQDWGNNKNIESGRNSLVYGTDAFYPAANVEISDVGRLRKWRIATVRYYPFRYNPLTRVLEQTTGGSISISYKTSATTASTSQLSDNIFVDKVKSLATNYAEAQSWYSTPRLTALSASHTLESTANYVIITTSAIVSGSSKIQAFVNHKISRGFSVEIITENQWGGGTGDIAANNIRAYLQTHYISKGIEYVMLVGDPTPLDGDVPMKMLWPRYSADNYREAPSDYYYADLTGNWDLNANGYFGEQDSDFGTGGVDRLPEVIVGRIPFYGNFSSLDSILQKIIDYESGVINGPWLHNVLVSMKPSDSSTPGYELGEAIKSSIATPAGMTTTRVYDSNYGLDPAPDYISCTYENVLAAWNQHAGFHFWWTHGNDTLASSVFKTSNCQYLDDDYPSFTFQCSCLNGNPENESNLGFALLKQGAIATDSASRVSWYYPGETIYTDTDSNAGMTYQYATKLITDHMPCGDAHFSMMVDTPNTIWMNHCVFNLYGDPSVAYPSEPVISHTPLIDTDITNQPYLVQADISSIARLVSTSPVLKWNTSGGTDFQTIQMTKTAGTTYEAYLPAQPYATIIYYFIEATDASNRSTTYPSDAPGSLLSFSIICDTSPPFIQHTPLSDTGNKFGPYPVEATVADDIGIDSVSLHYNINGGAYTTLVMSAGNNDIYKAEIPGPTTSGDAINYFITATDSSQNANTSRLPSSECFSFVIAQKICVAVFNSTAQPTYFRGINANAWSFLSDIINADPDGRFQVSVLTSLQTGLANQDVLVLPDNAVPTNSLDTVAEWFKPGKVILTLDSSVCYAAYTGWMWSGSTGKNGYDTYWDNYSSTDDQQIWANDPITAQYSIDQIISSTLHEAQYYVNMLPSDAVILSGKSSDLTRSYAVYRDVPDRGRLVMFGPFLTPSADQYSMIREALVAPPGEKRILVASPNGGETYESGDHIAVIFTAEGSWSGSETIKLEYCTGLNSTWTQVPGAESLAYDDGSFDWDTTGLPGSHGYRVRASHTAKDITDTSDAPFSVVPTVGIAQAKAMSDGTIIRVAGKVVTCSLYDFTYIEEPNRRAGIKVTSTQGIYQSELVDITGVIGTVNGERVIDAETTIPLGTGADIGPYALKMGALGGAAFGQQIAVMEYKWVKQSGTTELIPANGLNNIGLLVRVCGSVTACGENFFYIDDGSNCNDGSGNIGVKVFCPGITPPSQPEFVLINAISSTYFENNSLFRALVLPDAVSLQGL